eukprot:m.342463 g.342463  ORF g.342463 m.342463 type:complete len:265 (-) comp21399_c0_seq1:78-872(-)
MATHYELVWDQDAVRDFLRHFIPTAEEPNRCITMILFARRKYNASLPKSEYILDRMFLPGDKDEKYGCRLLVRQHVPVGAYVDNLENPIPPDSLCVYAVLHHKSMTRAFSETMLKMMGDFDDKVTPHNLLSAFKVNIPKETSNVPMGVKLTQIDLDTKDPEQLKQTCEVLDKVGIKEHLISITETRGGYHLVYKRGGKDIDHRAFHDFQETTKFKKIGFDGKEAEDKWLSTTHQPLVIIPGTYQGGFKARAVSVEDFYKSFAGK